MAGLELFGTRGIMTEIFSAKDIKWKAYKNNDKSKHAFLINRYFAIQFPVQAHAMNINGFNPYVTVEAWRSIGKQFKRAPKWFWTKANKAPKASKSKGKKYTPSDEIISLYVIKNEISMDQFNEAMKMNPKLLLTYLQRIEKSMDTTER